MRLRSLRSLPNVAFMSQGEAGESSRSQPGGGGSSTLGSGRRGCPSASAAADAISMRPLGVGKPSANCTRGSG